MNQFQTREERRQASLKRKSNIITAIIFIAIFLLVILERGCESDDTPMFIKTESQAK